MGEKREIPQEALEQQIPQSPPLPVCEVPLPQEMLRWCLSAPTLRQACWARCSLNVLALQPHSRCRLAGRGTPGRWQAGSQAYVEEISSLSARLGTSRGENSGSQVPPASWAPPVWWQAVAGDSSPHAGAGPGSGGPGYPMNPAAAGASVSIPGFWGAGWAREPRGHTLKSLPLLLFSGPQFRGRGPFPALATVPSGLLCPFPAPSPHRLGPSQAGTHC